MELDLDPIGKPRPASTFEYDWRACATYALGVGASDLRWLWEDHPAFAALPSFAVIPTTALVFDALRAVRADFTRLVHGAQRLRLHRPLPTAGRLRTEGVVSAVHDKGKGAVVLVDTVSRDADGPVFEARWSIFCRGQGGFGGERGVSRTPPDAVGEPVLDVALPTRPEQALIYRLSGDLNPLHVDPALAAKAGFDRPILHGLCTYGFAARALVEGCCGGDPARLRALEARFSGVVFPGETLRVVATRSAAPGALRFEVRVGERVVLDHGVAEVA